MALAEFVHWMFVPGTSPYPKWPHFVLQSKCSLSTQSMISLLAMLVIISISTTVLCFATAF